MYGMNNERASRQESIRHLRTLNVLNKKNWQRTETIAGKVFKDDFDPHLAEIRKVRVERELRLLERQGKAVSLATPAGTSLWRRA